MTHTYKNYEPVTEYTDETNFINKTDCTAEYVNETTVAGVPDSTAVIGTDANMVDNDTDDSMVMYDDTDNDTDNDTANENATVVIAHNICPQMPSQDVTDCIAKYLETGDTKYRDRVIYSHIDFVHAIIHRYHFDTMIANNASISYEDLLQVGLLGLMTAIAHFDITKQIAFSTYAFFWVRQHILRYIISVSNITIPVHLRGVLNRIAYIRYLLTEAGIEPTVQAVSDETGLTCDFVRELAQYDQPTLSLDAPVKIGGDALGEFLPDTADANIEDVVAAGVLQQTVEKYIFKLPAKDRDILFMRLGLNGYSKTYTLQEIADKYDITRERVRQIIQKHLRLMRYDKDICIAADKPYSGMSRGSWYHKSVPVEV